MDILDNPSLLFSGLFIGALGMAIFIYGKKRPEPKCIGIGLIMCVYPMFISSLLLLWLVTACCIGAAFALPKFD